MNIQQLINLETVLDDRAWDAGCDLSHEQAAGVTDEDMDDMFVRWEHLHMLLTAARIAIRSVIDTECLYPTHGPCTCEGEVQ